MNTVTVRVADYIVAPGKVQNYIRLISEERILFGPASDLPGLVGLN